MGRKKRYIIEIDTETTQDGLVADFGALVTDLQGHIVTSCGVLVRGVYDKPRKHPLFFTSDAEGIWSKGGQDRRYTRYNTMLENGSRVFGTVLAVNKWLTRALSEYNPVLTAYNLPFDIEKMRNTGIDCDMFEKRFCMWAAAYTKWAHKKVYRNFVLACHGFNAPTQLGNMTYKTNAEIMARFVTGNSQLPDEPHTALEDLIDYEHIIMCKLLKSKSLKWLLNEPLRYNWRNVQVHDWFSAK